MDVVAQDVAALAGCDVTSQIRGLEGAVSAADADDRGVALEQAGTELGQGAGDVGGGLSLSERFGGAQQAIRHQLGSGSVRLGRGGLAEAGVLDRERGL